MWKHSLCAAAVCGCLVADAAPAFSADIYAQLFPLTGEIRLLNRDAAPIQFVFYSIMSAGGAIDGSGGVWKSIADHYDVSGNGLVDPNQEWFKLSDDPMELTEAVFTGPGGSLPPTRAISLGQIWNPSAVPLPDLMFDIRDDEQTIPVTMELALDSDYSSNQVVDQADYVVWRRYLDSTTVLLADGNLNGVIDAADYLVWQQNFGLTLPLPPYGAGNGGLSPGLSGHAGIVPEPTTVTNVLCAVGWLLFVARQWVAGAER